MTTTTKKGNLAMEYIADYPLYAKTSGITYEEAIRVAEALNPKWEEDMIEVERFAKLSLADKEKEISEWKDV